MHERTRYTPLTVEEQRFAEENHQVVFWYLQDRKLDPEEWYDVVILRYLLSVKKWFQRPELHRWKFTTIAKSDMRSAIGNHLAKEARRIQTVSLYENVPGCEDMTYMDTITARHLDYINYGEEEMNISYNVKIPNKADNNKSDEAKALDNFLDMKDMRNMCFECADVDEGKKIVGRLRSYQKLKGQKDLYEVFRIKQCVYVVKAEAKESPKGISGVKKSTPQISKAKKSVKRTDSIKAVS
ncbi:MAG: hypothetical protein HFH10_15300 [Dorea sp.]|nr:hypothetical protein [uncultured Schaedlerella sp.]MCI9077112.1 hypothetical protein [Dorea sp.]